MIVLHFAIVYDSPLRLAILRDLLRDFESLYKIKPVLRQMTWMEGRQQLSSGEVGGEILDVCEVGTTWVSALAEREVLRPFSPRDSLSVGGPGRSSRALCGSARTTTCFGPFRGSLTRA